MLRTVISADGTVIAFDQLGEGPPVILVAGAFCSRLRTAPLAAALQGRFTILNCDRRGRGDSGDTRPYSIEREIEDLDALIADAGGSAAVFGHSSGATLAMEAAADGLKITKLVLYSRRFSSMTVVHRSGRISSDGSPSWSPPVGEAMPSSSTRPRRSGSRRT